MRAGLLLEALAGAGPVDVVVVPVSGAATAGEWLAARARQVLVVEPDPRPGRAPTSSPSAVRTPSRGAPNWPRSKRLPAQARLATPARRQRAAGRSVAQRGERPSSCSAAYLAPFKGSRSPQRAECRAGRDRRRRRRRGSWCGPAATRCPPARTHRWLSRGWRSPIRVLAASPVDARAMSSRYGFAVDTLPNAVGSARDRHRSARPRSAPVRRQPHVHPKRRRGARPRHRCAARGADRGAPRDRRRRRCVRRPARRPRRPRRRGARRRGGRAPSLPGTRVPTWSWFRCARAPGLRIKVARGVTSHRRPVVVATPTAVAGLDIVDGRSVHLGTSAAEARRTRRPTARITRREAKRRTVDEAEAVLSEHYLLDVVVPRAWRLLLGRPLEDT